MLLTIFGFVILYHEFFVIPVEDFGWNRVIPCVAGATMAGGSFLTSGGMWERFVDRILPSSSRPEKKEDG
jgi:hypothetical protein